MKDITIRQFTPIWFRKQYPQLSGSQSVRIARQHSYHWGQMSLEARQVILNTYYRRDSEGKTA